HALVDPLGGERAEAELDPVARDRAAGAARGREEERVPGFDQDTARVQAYGQLTGVQAGRAADPDADAARAGTHHPAGQVPAYGRDRSFPTHPHGVAQVPYAAPVLTGLDEQGERALLMPGRVPDRVAAQVAQVLDQVGMAGHEAEAQPRSQELGED